MRMLGRVTRARSAGAITLALALLVVPGALAGAPQVPAAAPSSPAPPELQLLEAKMQQLQIASERFTRTSRASLTVTEESSSSTCAPSSACHPSRPVRRVTHRKVSYALVEAGEVDVAGKAAEVSLSTATGHMPLLIETGSASYLHLPGTAVPAGRPWVRKRLDSGEAEALFTSLFPFHGHGATPTSPDASGPYAGLIDLLASGISGIRAVGHAIVNGQPTSEFDATVPPGRGVDTIGQLGPQLTAGRGATETVQAFLAESGLPLRVVLTVVSGSDRSATTTDLLAVNVPVTVKAPPAARTISAARFRMLSRESHGSSSGESAPRSKQ